MKSPSRLLAICVATACLGAGLLASTAQAASPGWVPVGMTGPTNIPPVQSEVQRLFVDAEGGSFTFLYLSPFGFTSVPYNASAAELQSSLEALPAVGAGNVTVSGGPGGPGGVERPYTLVFGGALANTDVPEPIVNGFSLVNGAVTLRTNVPGGQGTSKLVLMLQNVGGGTSSGPITYRAELPSGFSIVGSPTTAAGFSGLSETWDCGGSTATEILCTWGLGVRGGLTTPAINATITAEPGTESGTLDMEVSGGGASSAGSNELPLTVSATPAPPGMQSFEAGAYDDEGKIDNRAGGHPYAANAAIFANTIRSPKGFVVPAGEFRDIIVDLPPGFFGNPIAVPECPESLGVKDCSLDTMVATVQPMIISTSDKFGSQGPTEPVYNTEAPYGYPAKFRFEVASAVALNAVGELRSDGDYGVSVGSLNTPQAATLYGTFFTFFGEPASSAFDSIRCRNIEAQTGCAPSSAPSTAFLSNSTNCSEQSAIAAANGGLLPVGLRTTLWQKPGEVFHANSNIVPVAGCDKLKFAADFTFEPSDTKSDSPASFRTSLSVPSDGLTDPKKLMTPEIKDTVVTLPEGVVLNASGADGLEACSLEQIGYRGNDFAMPSPIRFDRAPQTCPDASKIGTGELKTALLKDPLKGALYLAAQGEGNPYGSLFAIYLVIENPRNGIFIKLPGRVDPDPSTGQMTVTFKNLPQLPFTRLDLNLKGGNRSALASPTTCGNYTTTATNTPWSAPESGPSTVSANGFEINQGANGLPCANTPAERPFDVGWSAGAQNVQSGASGPFHFRITRPDGSQELESLELNTPPGLSASLKGVPRCTEAQIAAAQSSTGKAEQANPACPAASQVGSLQTGAGSGPTPFYVGGKIYLAGPYKGAPISVVVVTPAVAGPFDLGNVVVRSVVNINRATAQVSAKSDPIPQFLKGVGLRIRDVRITLDRKDWTINPTSCDPSAVNLRAFGNSGAVTERSTRFQVGGCRDLGFKPRFGAKLLGGTKRGAHPRFIATVNWPEGAYANTKNVSVTLPRSEFLDQANIRTICTRVQTAADACPPGAIYGQAEATTPLLDEPLRGPVFLKSSDNKLPDLAIKLRGPASTPIEVEFQGRIDSIRGQIRNTIIGLPDVPVSKFVLRMRSGRKGLLVNSRDLCKTRKVRMNVRMLGHNNRRANQRPVLRKSCKKTKKKQSKSHKRRQQRR